MSVTIHWRPAKEITANFSGGTSSGLEVLSKTFGKIIGPQDIPALRGMALASRDEFYNEVADKIELVGSIEIWGEW